MVEGQLSFQEGPNATEGPNIGLEEIGVEGLRTKLKATGVISRLGCFHLWVVIFNRVCLRQVLWAFISMSDVCLGGCGGIARDATVVSIAI
jgi:hypothetical protein